MRRLAGCALLTLAVMIAFAPSGAFAIEDRDEFCDVIGNWARDHADDRGGTLTRAIGDEYAALAEYSKPSIAGDFRFVARFYRLRARLGSERKAAKALDRSLTQVTAVRKRVNSYQIETCRPDLADQLDDDGA